jgi:hypothetical protein
MAEFLKQYGERRTGTNYLRTLLLANFSNVVPLMHVLGDKHSPPVDIGAYWRSHCHLPDADWQFVRAATFAAPAESTRAHDVIQERYLRAVAAPVARAVTSGRVGYVISVKEPAAWAASLAKYSGWLAWIDGRRQMAPRFAPELKAACVQFNANYRAWLALHERSGGRSVVIRHEDLLDRATDVLADLAERFSLERTFDEWKFPAGAALPADWDHSDPVMYGRQFDAGFYRRREYVAVLSEPLWAIVRATIDWDLAATLGYRRSAPQIETGG